MSQFTTTKLTGQRVVVRGEDVTGAVGETVVSSKQWDDIKAHGEFDQASEAFDLAVDEFFAPIISAADALEGKVAAKPTDSTSYVVLHEEVEAVAGKPGVVVELSKDSIILRLIEEGSTDRLLWVGGDLEVAEPVTTSNGWDAPVPASEDLGGLGTQ